MFDPSTDLDAKYAGARLSSVDPGGSAPSGGNQDLLRSRRGHLHDGTVPGAYPDSDGRCALQSPLAPAAVYYSPTPRTDPF